ncbi:multicopper oxidase-domain-containing protein [Lasiosphaeria miniovina]|uniref:Multicopper oxidase-domain-containing protein n=1 Tax=Lasiosphaeria miniovina TaxID=1954250 RepID=A0AA40AWY0_9PEZI|nr:multicopper oxidase-domain-containing protein [Lasiosphaeria miniovina]KAK0723520.1 multicopper oxidase-domain-containing protein [Lasiosphaeria miniovina]
MGLLESCKALALYLTALLPSSLLEYGSSLHQVTFGSPFTGDVHRPGGHFPQFPAPNGPDDPSEEFVCKYPSLGKQWSSCSTADDRTCWLKNSDGSKQFDINTDYENQWPEGIPRDYYLVVNNQTFNADGIANPDGKVFNDSYPGPWIKACWGDLIRVTVFNNLTFNGTTVHWHGFRQLNSTEMDGVNGVTQCPIAPQHSYTYEFRATQYGTSWYHSHYSLQYADGLHGPITVFGPSSASYDEGRNPLIITDWNHRSAFKDWQRELVPKPSFPTMNSVLINGHGNFAGAFPRDKFNMTVTKGKKYLLRIINTSVDTTYIFSIDNHEFTVMSSDFVPVQPYNVSHIAVGIGQRYHVVLNAVPLDNGALSATGDYWIRAIPADGCKGFETGNEPDERQGILRYDDESRGVPTSFRDGFSTACRDENYTHLVPVLPWKIPPASISSLTPEFDIGKVNRPARPERADNFSWWAMGDHPLWLDFGRPTLLDLHNTTWNNDSVVITQDGDDDTWVYLVITGPGNNGASTNHTRSFFPVAHPMHLHGHDFALLAQGNDSSKLPDVKLKFDNPPRRDVVLLPSNGYVVVAFKADNPGSWLFHCHIPWHASSGLALQILERQADLQKMLTDARLAETRRVCREWDAWYADPSNHWNASAPFQDDSGI